MLTFTFRCFAALFVLFSIAPWVFYFFHPLCLCEVNAAAHQPVSFYSWCSHTEVLNMLLYLSRTGGKMKGTAVLRTLGKRLAQSHE